MSVNLLELKKQKPHDAFDVYETAYIEPLQLSIYACKHRVTGAMHYHLAHPSSENAFLVAFRTQPMDSRGTAHILEHTALCGSARYPVRDPFFSMLKRSLQTFMNAFTASDWTAYPFATQNAADYNNLLGVYLDAAFFPSLHELDFAQEGIRVELDEAGEPEFKGIVFNEMKGAMSSEISQLYQAVAKYLHPETTYHYNSGGDPACIPELTHADLVAFHKRHYHPSNAVFMSFGDKPLAELQTQLETQVLSHFQAGKKYASVPEMRLSKPLQATETYAVDSMDKKQTHHVLAWLLPTINDTHTRLAMRMVEGVLLEHAGSPLRKLLESSSLGDAPSPLLGFDDDHYEMSFYAGLRGSEPECAEAFESEVMALLERVASQPIPQQDIQMVLHQIELNERHINGDGMPYGLSLILEGLSSAIHDGNPLDVWQIEPHIDWLKEQLKDEHWLPGIIKQHLVDNPHRVRLSLLPNETLSQRMANDEQKKLNDIKSTLNKEKVANIRAQTEALAQRQAQVDDVSLLPKVGLADIAAEFELPQGDVAKVRLGEKSAMLHSYTAGTNGVFYCKLLLELPENLLAHPLLRTYVSLLGELGTHQYATDTFQALQAQHSGGISVNISARTQLHSKDDLSAYLVLSTYALDTKLEAFEMLKHCLQDTVFTDRARILELLKQKQARWQSRLSGSGHAYAMQTAVSGMSKLAGIEYDTVGLPALLQLKGMIGNTQNDNTQGNTQDSSPKTDALDALVGQLQALHRQVNELPMQVVLIAQESHMPALTDSMISAWQGGAESKHSEDIETIPLEKNVAKVSDNLAWLVATNVYHNAMAFAAVPADHADAPALMILAPYLRNNFLHRAIRETGGAYGGGASYDAGACAFKFYSYRDPRCEATFADFLASIDWMFTAKHDPAWLEEAILGTIAAIDKPGSPAGEASKTCIAGLHGRTPEWQAQIRSKLLTVSLADLQRVAQTYLQDKPFSRACLAPFDKENALKAAGFEVSTVS